MLSSKDIMEGLGLVMLNLNMMSSRGGGEIRAGGRHSWWYRTTLYPAAGCMFLMHANTHTHTHTTSHVHTRTHTQLHEQTHKHTQPVTHTTTQAQSHKHPNTHTKIHTQHLTHTNTHTTTQIHGDLFTLFHWMLCSHDEGICVFVGLVQCSHNNKLGLAD